MNSDDTGTADSGTDETHPSDANDDDSVLDRVADRRRGFRRRIARNPTVDVAYRVSVAVVGTLVLGVGILAIPYPGPGWLIVFAGLGILASEFAWARRLLKFARQRYDRFMDWFSQQSLVVKAAGVLLTTVVVLLTLWLLGALALVAGWVGLDWPWLASPL